MIHATLRWPGFVEKDLWPQALSHAAYLYNITPKMETGVSPISVFTKTMQESHTLRNAHTWGCPVYVLTPKLKDGQKIPKWEPRSKRGQFVGHSPLHASTVGLVRNLQTGNITPQFHLVYNDYFETVHSRDDQEPESWNELLRFNRFQTEFDEDQNVPDLPDEWLNPQELIQRREQRERNRDDIMARNDRVPLIPEEPDPEPIVAQPIQVAPTVHVPQPTPTVIEPQIVIPAQPVIVPPIAAVPTPPANTRPVRTRNQPVRFHNEHSKYYTKAATALCMKAAKGMVSCCIGYESDYRFLLALLTDADTGHIDSIAPDIMQFAGAFKATPGSDPDLPTFNQAMCSPDKGSYIEAMTNEVNELADHRTWDVSKRSSVPQGSRVLPFGTIIGSRDLRIP